MEEIINAYDASINTEMILEHQNDPFWRRTYILKCLDRWEHLISNSEIRMDLGEMTMRAFEDGMLMWPLGRAAFAHESGCDEVELDTNFTSKSFVDRNLLLKFLRFMVSEPELSEFIRREERKPVLSNWYDEKFAWKDTEGNEVRLTNFILKLSEYGLNEFFSNHDEKGYSATQLYIFTQTRHHDIRKCPRVLPFSGLSAIQKPIYFDEWPHPDGFTYSEQRLEQTISLVRQFFERKADRPIISPLSFNLN